jgi:DNA polymerase-1
MQSTPRLIIIDGNAIIHRAYHAIPPMTTKNGVLVNAVYGFTSMFLKVWRELKPDYVAVTFDMSGGTFRNVKYKDYKATRMKADQALYDQIPLVHQMVEALGIQIFEKKGFEADDIIGTIAHSVKNTEVFVVTGDMDTLQLVRDNVKVYTLRKGMSDIVIYDDAEVEKRYGFSPKQVIEYKALAGDTSDNIKGVPGIGEKTATDLIKKFGTIEKIYEEIDNERATVEKEVRPAVLKKLEEGKESAFLSKELATIECNVPDLGFDLEKCKLKPFDREKVIKLFQEFEFVSLLKRIPELGATSVEVGKEKKSSKKKNTKKKFEFQEISSENDTKELITLISEEKLFAAKVLLSGSDVFTGTINGMLLIVQDKVWYAQRKFLNLLLDIFSLEDVTLVGHDLKQLVKALTVYGFGRDALSAVSTGAGINLKNQLFDIMIASYLLQPGSRAHDPAGVILKTLGQELTIVTQQSSLFGIDPRVQAEELYLLFQCYKPLKKDLESIDDYGLMEKIEMPTMKVLAEMELNGVFLDTKRIAEISKENTKELAEVTKTIHALAGVEFNISSPIQLREVLFEKLEIPVEGLKKGKTGLSTSAETLELIRDQHPIIPLIEQYRELTKLQNTYIDVLPTLINPKTHRIHTNYNQAIAATGRLSSIDPNLQNIPVRTKLGLEVRKAFIAEEGNILVSADYSQIELRVVASLAQDKEMMEIFEKGLDIHQATAAAIHEVPLDKVTKDMRYAAKEINFGILYGMGTYGLSWRAGISHAQAKTFIAKYFQEFSGVRKYLDETLKFTKEKGYCETLFGRRRYIPELASTNFQARASGERMAINHPIQGTAADIMKMAMIAVNDALKSKKYSNDKVKMILQVHDELVLEVEKGLEDEIGELLKETMEHVVELRVPVKVEIHGAKSWGEMK